MKLYLRQLILGLFIALIPAGQAGTILAYTNFQLNAINEDRPLYDPNECSPSADPTNNNTVVLDPGHSGGDLNATQEVDGAATGGYKSVNITNSGVQTVDNGGAPGEMQNMWDAAQLIKATLSAAGYKVILTKKSATDNVGLLTRAKIANDAKASIAVSLHYTGDVPFGVPNNHFGVTPQTVGLSRTNQNGGGSATFKDASVASLSQQYATAIAAARTDAGDKVSVSPLDNSFPKDRGLPSYGDISIVQLFSKVPWVYNEDGAVGFNVKKYSDGISAGIIKAVSGKSGPTTATSAAQDVLCCAKIDSSSGPLSGSDNQQKAFNFFVSKGLSGVQAAGAVGNIMQESGVDPHSIQAGGPGRGIIQWSVGDRWQTLLKFAASSGRDPWSLEVQLDFAWKELGSDYPDALRALKAANSIPEAVQAWEKKYEICGDCQEPSRIKYANTVLKLYGNGAPATGTGGGGSDTSGGCATSADGVVAGSVVKTAVGLAWPNPYGTNPSHSFFDPTPAYKKVWNGSSDYTDCGVFVASVMVKSGADPKYPPVGTGVQVPYLKAHADKYIIINAPHSTSQLRPGDIEIYDNAPAGHTFFWVGPQKGGFTGAAASLGGHTPQLETTGSTTYMFGMPGVIIARHR